MSTRRCRSSSQPIEALYEAPYLAHARLEPYACVAQIKDGVCEVWTGTQIPGQAHSTAVQASGLQAGSGEGAHDVHGRQLRQPRRRRVRRRSRRDREGRRRAGQADLLARRRAAARPVSAGVARCGSWRLSTPTAGRTRGSRASPARPGWGCATASPARASKASPTTTSRTCRSSTTIPVFRFRPATGDRSASRRTRSSRRASSTSWRPPAARIRSRLRRRLYAKSPRLLGVLNLAAEKADWGTPLPAGRFRGVAAVAGFGSFNAQVAEISIAQGKVRVHRVVCAVDCGRVINPTRRRAAGAGRDGLRPERRAARQHHHRPRPRRRDRTSISTSRCA